MFSADMFFLTPFLELTAKGAQADAAAASQAAFRNLQLQAAPESPEPEAADGPRLADS